MPREIGSVIGDYWLVGLAGSGASGEVYQAEHSITHRIEAIKFLTHAATEEDEQVFRREIEVQASMRHPNIAAVHNAFRTSDGLALVMEFVDGQPLSSLLVHGGVPLRQGVSYLLKTLEALGYAHERGVVHRDVKPGNILVTREGSVKLTDFGLAQRLDGYQPNSGTPAGSPYYMSPEQVVGLARADARSDIYSVGVILYEIATGRRPFEGESAFDVLLQQRERLPAPPVQLAPGIGATLNAVILRAIEKDPARRFQSAAEFRTALERAVNHSPARRVRAAVAWIGAGAALAGMVALGAYLHRPPAAKQAPAVHSRPPVQAPAPVPVAPLPRVEIQNGAPPAPAMHKEIGTSAAARRRKSPTGTAPPEERAIAPVVLPPEVKPHPKTEAAELAPAPIVRVAPAPVQPPLPAPIAPTPAAPEVAPPVLAKRPNFLRRAVGRILHPGASKSKQQQP